MPPALIFVCILCVAVIGIMSWLRYIKGKLPLREGESHILPSAPGVRGVVMRLDGMDRKNRPIHQGRLPRSLPDGSLSLPCIKWESGPMSVARLAVVAHTWAQAKQAEEDPRGYKDREQAVARARVVPVLGLFFCMMMIFAGRLNVPVALTIMLSVWTLMIAISIPSQFREWKAVAIAKNGLKRAGLYPQLQDTANALDRCLTALSWCRVAGFAQIIPK